MNHIVRTSIALCLLWSGLAGASVLPQKLYVTGNDNDAACALWITDLSGNPVTSVSPIELPEGSSGHAESIAISPAYAYIVGEDENGNAVLWITTLAGQSVIPSPTKLPTSPGVYNGVAKNVALSANRAFVVGQDFNGFPVLWITLKTAVKDGF